MSHLYYTHSFNSESLWPQFEAHSASEIRLRKDITRDKNCCLMRSSKREENSRDCQPGKELRLPAKFQNYLVQNMHLSHHWH